MPDHIRSVPCRRSVVAILTAILAATLVLAVGAEPAGAEGTTYVVAPSGSDNAAGTAVDPFASVEKGLVTLRPGDTLLVRGGTYRERIRTPVTVPGRADAPIAIRAFPGERPEIEGLLWLRNPSYWTIDGLNVTWSAANSPGEHMVKMIDGVGWSLVNSELWGARSYAALLVASSKAGEPANWRVANNCIHDTHPTNSTNQDQLIYANTGLEAGAGVIERNLLFNATNGMGIKLGGPSESSGGAARVTVRNNTIYNTAQNMLVSWRSRYNTIHSNLMVKVGTNYGNIRGYKLTGSGNKAYGNAGGDARLFLLNDPGYTGIADGGNTFPVDPQFNSIGCGGLVPLSPQATDYGRYAPGLTAATRAGSAGAAPDERQGYWLLGADGGIFSFGDAAFHGSTGAMSLNRPVVGMAATPTGNGYWLVASDGGIFAFGDAAFHGSTGAISLNQPIVGTAATPTGNGYWLVASDGGIFAFGDAAFHGSASPRALGSDVVALHSTGDGGGYWIAAANGSVGAYGSAHHLGSASGPASGLTSTEDGYWVAGPDGGVFSFGLPYLGSMGGQHLQSPIIAITAA